MSTMIRQMVGNVFLINSRPADVNISCLTPVFSKPTKEYPRLTGHKYTIRHNIYCATFEDVLVCVC